MLGPRTLVVATAAMATLLVGLAALQYRWLGQVSAAERERLRSGLETAADRISDDVDREISRAFMAFLPAPPSGQPVEERLSEGFRRWSASALDPDLVEAVFYVVATAEREGDPELWRFDPAAETLTPQEWFVGAEPIRRRLQARRAPDAPTRPLSPRGLVLADPLAIVLSTPAMPAWARRPNALDERREAVVVTFDRERIVTALLPSLLDAHLGAEPRGIQAQVITRTRSPEVVYRTSDRLAPPVRDGAPPMRDGAPPVRGGGDVRRPLFAVRLFPDLRPQGFQSFFDDPETRRHLDAARRRPPPGMTRRPPVGGDDAAWTLVLTRSEGSLEAAVARLRRRNLAIGLAMVALLGATAALLLASARQMQRLAHREMELVAGITHELRTPLASIGAAADNLADGVVREPDQVRRYGGLIKSEAHRLGALVAQVLDFAGTTAARRPSPRLQPVDLEAAVDSVLADHRFTIGQKGFTIERRGFSGDRSPTSRAARALADPDALRRALDNVVGNALKYGEAGRWLGVEIRPQPGVAGHGGERGGNRLADRPGVELRIRDRGPGIARADRHRVFEPFQRGAGAAGHLHGTGLGLSVTRSLLESMGGAIEIEESEPGLGTTFLILLQDAGEVPEASTAPPTS